MGCEVWGLGRDPIRLADAVPLEELDQVLVVRVFGTALPREAAALREGALVQVALLVVPAVHEDRLRARELEREQQHEDFDPVAAAVGHVAVEEVVVPRLRLAVELEDPQHVLQLAVRVAAHVQPLVGRGGRREPLQRALLALGLLARRDQHLVHAALRDRPRVRAPEVAREVARLLQREGRRQLEAVGVHRRVLHLLVPERRVVVVALHRVVLVGVLALEVLHRRVVARLLDQEVALRAVLHLRPRAEALGLHALAPADVKVNLADLRRRGRRRGRAGRVGGLDDGHLLAAHGAHGEDSQAACTRGAARA